MRNKEHNHIHRTLRYNYIYRIFKSLLLKIVTISFYEWGYVSQLRKTQAAAKVANSLQKFPLHHLYNVYPSVPLSLNQRHGSLLWIFTGVSSSAAKKKKKIDYCSTSGRLPMRQPFSDRLIYSYHWKNKKQNKIKRKVDN